MLLSAMSVLVVAQSSSEIPEGLMNNPVLFFSSYQSLVEVCLLHPTLLRIRRAFLAFGDVTVHNMHDVYVATTINDCTYGLFTDAAITSKYIPSKANVFYK